MAVYEVFRGLVLRQTETKEADKILTVLTAEKGKISVIARGARRKGSRLAAASQLLVFSEMTAYESKGWYMLTEASTLQLFPGLREDVERLSLASYFAEIVEGLSFEGESAEETLRLLLNALYALGELKKPMDAVKAAFELRLLCIAGFAPLLEECGACGKTEMPLAAFDIADGELFCADCAAKRGGELRAVDGGALSAMRHIACCDQKKLYAFHLSEESQKRLSQATEDFLLRQLDRRFRTLDFYHSLKM